MCNMEAVIRQIHQAFDRTPYPGDAYLQGSFEGCEPGAEVSPFRGQTDWRALEGRWLDEHGEALSFFSEAGFRFFLPAYLVADLRDELDHADPLFHLTNGFSAVSVEVPVAGRVFVRSTGGSVLLNPNRYGAMTFGDYARFRLSVFTREEAGAIVAYLDCRRTSDIHGIYRAGIDASLTSFWLGRARHAPSALSLDQHLKEDAEYLAHLQPPAGDTT